MPPHPPTRNSRAPRGSFAVLALALCAALLLAVAAPASATSRKQAANRALTALGSKKGTAPVIVFGLTKAVRADGRVTQAGSKRRLVRFPKQRAFFFYEDSGPYQAYSHPGRVAMVGAKTGKVKLSKTIMRAPLVNGKRAAFLASSKAYRSSRYRIFSRARTLPNSPPKAEKQGVTVKRNHSKNITLTASDGDGDMLLFAITKQPDHGTLSGVPPHVVYTPNTGYLGKDKFAFKSFDDVSQSNTAHVDIDVVPLGQPPAVATSAGCTAYTEHTAAVVVDGALTASDPDDTTLDSARVRVSGDFQDGDDLLFTDQNGIEGSYDDGTGVLTLTGDSSVANYQGALRTVRYRNLSSQALAPSKTVEFTTNDAGSDSAPATKQLCTTGGSVGGNDRPNGEPSEGALSYIENDGPVTIDTDFVLGDPDSPSLSGATIQLIPRPGKPAEDDELGNPGTPTPDSVYLPGQDVLSFTDLDNGITGSFDSVTGTLTLSGTGSIAAYETALRSVTYENTSEDPSAAPRTVRFRLTDTNGSNSTPSTRDIFVTPVNDAPVVTTSEGSASYVGNGPGVAIDGDLTASDVDDTDLEGAQARISAGFEAGDELVFEDQPGISGSYDGVSGVLTLFGSASESDYQAALRSVEFSHEEGNAAGSRTVEFTVNDGELDSAAATKGIEVNDKPVLDTTDAALAYSENAGPVAVDADIGATDADSATLQGATVQISSNFVQAEDELAFTDLGNGISGSYDDDTGTLALSGSASVADYQATLRAVTYENSSDNPSTDTRTVTFQADDGAASNSQSDPATRDIEITPVNDAPSVTPSGASASYVGSGAATAVDPSLTVADVDDTNIESAEVQIASGLEAGDELVYEDQFGIEGDYDSDTGLLTLTGSASVADYETALRSVGLSHEEGNAAGSRTVDFTVNDGELDSDAASATISVNDPPVLDTTDTALSFLAGSGPVAIDPGLTITDADSATLQGATVQITANGAPGEDELAFVDQLGITGFVDDETGVLFLSGSAPVSDYETALRTVTYDNSSGTPSTDTRTVQFQVDDGAASNNQSDAATRDIEITVPPPPD